MQQPTMIGHAENHGQVIALDSRRPEQVVSDKQYLKILQISDLLSRHLEMAEIISVFSYQIMSLVEHSGYRYRSQQLPNPISKGLTKQNSLHYQLTIQQMDLGELTIYRDEPFGTNEVCQFEDLLCALVYPLRNALMYQRAITSAYRDPLTNINNRAAMDKFLPREVNLAKRHKHNLAMMIMDLDGFKRVNDNYGHDVGDRLLQTVAIKIMNGLRETDMLFRYGGDEFVAALPHTNEQGATDVADRILHAIKKLGDDEQQEFSSIGMSIGVSMLHADDDFQNLFKRADMALYRAKNEGKHRFVFS